MLKFESVLKGLNVNRAVNIKVRIRRLAEFNKKMNRIYAAQECDARNDNQGTEAG